jgi:hypothetical protein
MESEDERKYHIGPDESGQGIRQYGYHDSDPEPVPLSQVNVTNGTKAEPSENETQKPGKPWAFDGRLRPQLGEFTALEKRRKRAP